jgi:hypothetical protein
MIIDWKYDSIAAPISAYQVEVLDGSGTVIFDTGKNTDVAAAETTTQSVTLNFSTATGSMATQYRSSESGLWRRSMETSWRQHLRPAL